MKRYPLALVIVIGAVLSALPMQAQTKAHRVLFAMTSPEEVDWPHLVEGSEVVPAGIVEVVKKQERGWSYLKAGR